MPQQPDVLAQFKPQPNPWLVVSGEYSGLAELRMTGGITITGEGRVEWDATGECRIWMDVAPDSLHHAFELGIANDQLLHFRLKATDGTFEAPRTLVHKSHMNLTSP